MDRIILKDRRGVYSSQINSSNLSSIRSKNKQTNNDITSLFFMLNILYVNKLVILIIISPSTTRVIVIPVFKAP